METTGNKTKEIVAPQEANQGALTPEQQETVSARWGSAPDDAVNWMTIPYVNRKVLETVGADPTKHPDGYGFWIYMLDLYSDPNRVLKRVLSIPCGHGHQERTLARHRKFLECDAYDISVPALERARDLARAEGLTNINHECRDLNDLKLSHTYDLVIGGGIHHVSNLEGLFSEISRSLAPGGFFLLYEYIGPARCQPTARQVEAINACINLLPKRYRVRISGQRKLGVSSPEEALTLLETLDLSSSDQSGQPSAQAGENCHEGAAEALEQIEPELLPSRSIVQEASRRQSLEGSGPASAQNGRNDKLVPIKVIEEAEVGPPSNAGQRAMDRVEDLPAESPPAESSTPLPSRDRRNVFVQIIHLLQRSIIALKQGQFRYKFKAYLVYLLQESLARDPVARQLQAAGPTPPVPAEPLAEASATTLLGEDAPGPAGLAAGGAAEPQPGPTSHVPVRPPAQATTESPQRRGLVGPADLPVEPVVDAQRLTTPPVSVEISRETRVGVQPVHGPPGPAGALADTQAGVQPAPTPPVMAGLPEEYFWTRFVPMTKEQWDAVDPTESVRSDEIIPLLKKYFAVVDVRYAGGCLLQFTLYDIAGNFYEENEETRGLLDMLFKIEEVLVKHDDIPQNYAVIVAKNR